MFRRCFTLFRRPSEAYRAGVAAGTIQSDENQIRALPVFDRLYDDLVKYTSEGKRSGHPKRGIQTKKAAAASSGFMSFFSRGEAEPQKNRAIYGGAEESSVTYHPLSNVKGLYVWGGVGCGKTMLMDLLYANAPQEIKKMRIHFHQFMLDVQKTSHSIRQSPNSEIDLFDELAQRLVSNVELLCFDEVAVNDVAHAMILKRLFNAFYKIGLVVIFTSNRAPDNLYLGGLNRGGFLPFIDLVKDRCVVYNMVSETDHRLMGHKGETYLSPLTPENEKKFASLFSEFCKGMPATERKLKIFGRDVIIPHSCGGVCMFEFYEICGAALSTADYEIIAKTYNTVFINGVPQFDYKNSDVKNRFLLLIDTLYDYRCKVVISAAVEPALLQKKMDSDAPQGEKRWDQLSEFERDTGKKMMDESDASFQMERCISRLYEMSTSEYLSTPHRYQDVTTPAE